LVLTVNPKAYVQVSDDLITDIPSLVHVERAFALYTARHLAFCGRYLRWMALPDRWISWIMGAVPAGLRLICKYQPKILWSTYPIATAHLIGYFLHCLTGIPWVSDFRDPMIEVDPSSDQRWPTNSRVWAAREWIERRTVRYSARAIFVTEGALRMYAERYPEVPDSRWAMIANGYDEESFAAAELIAKRQFKKRDHMLLLHSGTLYPTPDRDPSAFLSALKKLRTTGHISSSNIRVRFRSSGHDEYYRKLVHDFAVEDLVDLEPPLPYHEALAEMLNSDGLLIFQGHDSNPAIPAKLYEYVRARRPIFAMVDFHGQTANALESMEVGTLAPLTDPELIADGLLNFLQELKRGEGVTANAADIIRYSRASRSQELAQLFNDMIS